MTDNYDDLQRVVENLAVTDGLTAVLNLLPGNKLSVASRMRPVQDAIRDRNTTARVEWGIRHPDGRVFGLALFGNYKAWQTQKAVALKTEAPIGA